MLMLSMILAKPIEACLVDDSSSINIDIWKDLACKRVWGSKKIL